MRSRYESRWAEPRGEAESYSDFRVSDFRMSAEPEFRLILELEQEAARWRRRSMFLLSIILHALLIMLVLVSPKLFRRGAELVGVGRERDRQREVTFLTIPTEALKRLQEPPPTDILSDKNRRAQGRSPVIDPNGLRMPYMRGNSQLPEIAGGSPPTPPAAAPAVPPPAGTPGPAPPPPPKKEEGVRLMDVSPEGSGGSSQLRLPVTTPGQSIQQSLEAAVRSRANGPVPGPGDSTAQFNNLNPSLSMEGPRVLSDTRGVDFGPYLARIVAVVRRNWYAVIPESARLGEKGVVAIVFEILKDGSVPELQLRFSSGKDELDRAALASIRASNPFPPLPQEFTGNHLVLEFIFLYNVGYGP